MGNGKVIEIRPDGKTERRILVDLLKVLETEKPITHGELEERMKLQMKIKNPHPNMFKDYQIIYELLLGIAASRGLVSLGHFCENICEYITTCPSTNGHPCYMLTEEGAEYLEENRKAGHA